MIHRIEILTHPRHPDPVGGSLLARIRAFSTLPIQEIRTAAVYRFADAAISNGAGNGGGASSTLDAQALLALGEALYTDPILNTCHVEGRSLAQTPFDWYVEVGYRPGVTDNVGRTAQESLEHKLGRPLAEGHHVHSAQGYFIRGNLDGQQVRALAGEWMANDLIQQILVLAPHEVDGAKDMLMQLPVVELQSPVGVQTFALESVEALMALSKERLLALSPDEAGVIMEHYDQPDVVAKRKAAGLGAEATDVELEVIAQTWSEHCKHKIFNAHVTYHETPDAPGEEIRSLFKTYIHGTTNKVREAQGSDDMCLSVFGDNAGVIRFDDDWGIVMKVETHNSPSALDPYGGALTGIVGVNRDPFGTGRGAELLFNTDVFCFADPFHDAQAHPLPPRLLHPRRIYEGVRLGVEHGGNKSGVPTINGSVTFHERYLGKPLVFCGTGALMPLKLGDKPGYEKWVNPGDKIIMVGGRIGADGIHGATFSSLELSESSPVTAVQIGDPITQKKMFDFLIEVRKQGLYNAITDNGAGGLSSSVGEMAQFSNGATLHLDKAPLKYPGLQPWEIFISEAQERMTLAVPPEKVAAVLALSARMDVESTVLGEFNDSGVLLALHGEQVVAHLDMHFLHEGLPPMQLQARWHPPARPDADELRSGIIGKLPGSDLTPLLKRVLGRLNVCSKESMVRQYDHEVQGHSVIKPLVGEADDGPSDGAVIRPVLNSMQGLAVAHGMAPRYSDLDTYHMAACAVDEAVRGIVAVGGNPRRIAGLDNFCWCDPLPAPNNPDAEHKMAQLVRAVRALYDVSVAYGIPLISGKDSMKNDYVNGEQRISVPPTLLYTAVGIVEDVRKAVTMDVKAAGDKVYLIGATRAELGASELAAELGLVGGKVPSVDVDASREAYHALHQAMLDGLIRSAHDCSDGGLAVTLAETAFAGGLGLEVDMNALITASREKMTPAEWLFSESPGRLVVTMHPDNEAALVEKMAGSPLALLGTVVEMPVEAGGEAPRLRVVGDDGETWLDAPLADLKAAWQDTLKNL